MFTNLSEFQLTILNDTLSISIDCENEDLNDFFQNEAKKYQKELLAKTYCWINTENKLVAMVSLSNDNIELSGTKKRKLFEREKHFRYYPAVKIGRLGVDKDFKRAGLGSQILSFLKIFFVIKNKTGCRFLTLDAYNDKKVLDFYLKNDFLFLHDKDKNAKTRIMYFDLITIYNTLFENLEINKDFEFIIRDILL